MQNEIIKPQKKVVEAEVSPAHIEWQAPEYEYHEKSPDWFWAVGVISLAIFLASLFAKNLLFGILALFAGFSTAVYGARKPNTMSFKIDHKGIYAGKNLFPYENLKSFWILYDPPHKKEILIESKKAVMPRVTIMLDNVDPEKVRALLLPFLEEKEIKESFASIVTQILKI